MSAISALQPFVGRLELGRQELGVRDVVAIFGLDQAHEVLGRRGHEVPPLQTPRHALVNEDVTAVDKVEQVGRERACG